jgi:hypothetical protein
MDSDCLEISLSREALKILADKIISNYEKLRPDDILRFSFATTTIDFKIKGYNDTAKLSRRVHSSII